jgi:tetratricopeptide (TPR) repeat protein
VGEWKYVAAPKPELYDLRADREEGRNLVHDRTAVAGRLAAEIGRLPASGQNDLVRPAQPDPATVERLRALGYVGTFSPVTSGSSVENPLDRIADYRAYRELFSRALTLLGQNRPAAAAGILQQLLKKNVRAFEAHLYLGNAYAAQGKAEAALGEYDVAGMLNPSLATPDFEAAKVLSARGDHQPAVERCLDGLRKEPRSFYGSYTLGVVYQKAGRWPEALTAFAKAIEINGMDPRAHANLAGAAMRTGDVDRAAVHFERMIELDHQVAPAQFNLGVIAARKGNLDEAARRYRLSLAADPAFKPAKDALAKLKIKAPAARARREAAERERAGALAARFVRGGVGAGVGPRER